MRISDWSSDVCSSDLLRQMLDRYPDLERIPTRIALRSVRPRELASLREALALLPEVARHLDTSFSTQPRLAAFIQDIDIPPAIRALPPRARRPDPPLLHRDGGVMPAGSCPDPGTRRPLAPARGHT